MKLVAVILLFCGSAMGQNLLRNSSFEAGELKGWSWSGNYLNNVVPFGFTNLASYHGTNCMRLGNTKVLGNQLMSSEPIELPAGTYNLSFYALRQSGSSSYNLIRAHVVDKKSGVDVHNVGSYINSGSWTRYNTGTFTTASNSTYNVLLYGHCVTSGSCDETNEWFLLDAVQLEATSLTDYALRGTLEIGANLNRNVPGHVWYDGQTPSIPLRVWNDGATAATSIRYRVFDHYNAQLISGAISHTATAGPSTNVLNYNPGKRGAFRVQYWLDGVPNSGGEVGFVVVPEPVTLANRTNGYFGTHTYPSAWSLGTAQRLGFHWNRDFYRGRWNLAEPVEGTFEFYTNETALVRTYEIEPLFMLGMSTVSIPAFGQIPSGPGTGWPITAKWSNFVANAVLNNSNYVQFYEVWNEQANHNENEFTNVAVTAAAAIRANQPSAVIVSPADFYYTAVSNAIYFSGTTNWMDIWSSHNYPSAETPLEAAYAAYFGRVAWNTETGMRNDNWRKDVLWEDLTANDPSPTYSPYYGGAYGRDHVYRDTYVAYNILATFGAGMVKHFYYDGRSTGGADFMIPYSYVDYDQTTKPGGAMQAWVHWVAEGATHTGNANLASCLFSTWTWSRSNQVWFACFPTNCVDLTGDNYARNTSPKIFVSTSEQTVTFYDLYGNAISGAATTFGRNPIFIAGASGMSSNTLRASLTIYATNDTAAPQLAWSSFPTGGETNTFRFRWYAVDDTSIDTRTTVTNDAVRYQYSINGGAYSSVTNWASATVSTTNLSLFTVRATDPAGNVSYLYWPDQVTTVTLGGSGSGTITIGGSGGTITIR